MTTVDYQLGNGKRSSLAVPQHLPPLVQRLVDPTGAIAAEAGLSSGTVSLNQSAATDGSSRQCPIHDYSSTRVGRMLTT